MRVSGVWEVVLHASRIVLKGPARHKVRLDRAQLCQVHAKHVEQLQHVATQNARLICGTLLAFGFPSGSAALQYSGQTLYVALQRYLRCLHLLCLLLSW
jgi:hypothetical protein